MPRLTVGLALVASVTLGLGLLAPSAQAEPGSSITYETIPGVGGTPLKGFAITPTGQGPGPFPVVVMPSSWAVNNLEYVAAGAKLAKERGIVVVSYTSRGFYDSAGLNDVAGAETVGDVSKVIDWALANTPADPNRVGSAGISYGAGQSLLAAAADPRIKAVSAMSAWADLEASLLPNNTINGQAAAILTVSGELTSRPGPVLRQAEVDLLEGDLPALRAIAPERSASTKVDRINANRTAVMIANAWDDALFPPNQIADFYSRLTGSKRLLLAPGDHATAEGLGLLGITNKQWDDTGRWFERHLKGTANGVDQEKPVQIQDKKSRVWRGYDTWAAVGTPRTSYLGDPHWLTGFGHIGAQPMTGWDKTINAGWPTIANSGIAIITGAMQGFFGIAPTVSTVLVDKFAAGVWSTDSYDTATRVQGAPRVRTTVTPTTANTTLYAYLYDVDAFGVGELITHKPFSLLDATPGQARTIDFAMEATSWTVPAGHHLSLVIDTVDLRYVGRSSLGSQVSFSSPSASPSTLTVPIG